MTLTPIFTFLFSLMFAFYSRVTGGQVLGLVIGLICSLALTMDNFQSSPSINVNILYVALATVCFGLNNNYIKRYLADLPAIQLCALSLFFSSLMSISFWMLTGFSKITISDNKTESLVSILLVGIVGTSFVQWLLSRLIIISTPIFASLPMYLIPAVAVFWGVVDGEPLTWLHVLLCGVILFSIFLIQRDQQHQQA